MRPMTLVALLGVVLCVALWLTLDLASAEEKITWAIEDMVEGYGEGDVGDCTEYLAAGWSHEQSPGADREYLKQGLRGRFLQDMQSRKERRAEIDEGTRSRNQRKFPLP